MATKHHEPHAHLASTFGDSNFGQLAEQFARAFGTPKFIIGQTCLVACWIVLNAMAVTLRWDPYPFILLNLAFSTQAAYAAPLILLAQTRQAARDKAWTDADARHREELQAQMLGLLSENTLLTKAVHDLTLEIHKLVEA